MEEEEKTLQFVAETDKLHFMSDINIWDKLDDWDKCLR